MTAAATDRELLRELLEAASGDAELARDAPADETLSEYLAGRLPEERAERVRAWVVADPEAAERLLELEPFARAAPAVAAPQGADVADVADLETRSAWRDFERRRAEPRPDRRARRWPTAVAAVLALATLGLGLRVWQLEQTARRPIANLRTLELLGDVRAGEAAKRFEIVRGQPFRVAVYPAAPPAGCATYRAVVRDVEKDPVGVAIDGLVADARGRLDFLLPGVPGSRVLELEACGAARGRFRFDLLAAEE